VVRQQIEGSSGSDSVVPLRLSSWAIVSDPDFEAKLVDVVGLYRNPPERAVAFSFDEERPRSRHWIAPSRRCR
jgi:hypothetical protein